MGVVGSLPSSQPSCSRSCLTNTLHAEPIPPKAVCIQCIVPMDGVHEKTDLPLISNIKSENKSVCSTLVSPSSHPGGKHDFSQTFSRQIKPPTLATGRRSKFLKLEGDEAIKRELRRKRNRDAAKKLKAKRETVERALNKQIYELETQEQDLFLLIKSLEFYKEDLKQRCETINSPFRRLAHGTFLTTKQNEQARQTRLSAHVSLNNPVHIKQERRSPSPPWKSLFII